MADERIASRPPTAKRARMWGWALALGAVLALVIGAFAFEGKPRTNNQAATKALNGTNTTQVERPASVGQSNQGTGYGLSYETCIPRPTVKGYYEPKVVPYPVGKPVHVNGYYRQNGTYVQPHFRSLPRR